MQAVPVLTELQTAVCAVALLLAPLAVAGLVMINAGFGRSRSAAHSLIASLCAFAAASLSFVIFGGWLASYAGGPAHSLQVGATAWRIAGAAGLFLRGIKFDGLMNSAALSTCFLLMGAGLAAMIAVGSGVERWRLTPSILSSALLAGITYPLLAHWVWSGGWLAQFGAIDGGGAAVIQGTGGFTALGVTWLLGPRAGKYEAQGMAIPGHNMAMVIYGCAATLAGFLGLNAAGAILFAQAPLSSLPLVAINLLAASSASLLTALVVTRLRYAKPDASICANGFVGGLVAASAGCALVPVAAAVAIGFVSGLLLPFAVEWIDRLGYDDPSGAIAVHGVCAVWGVLSVGLFARGAHVLAQLALVSALLGFVLPLTYLLNLLLGRVTPLRINKDGERLGMDLSELGAGAYPELGQSMNDVHFR
ncbi:MAG: hypothetical protein P4M01_05430 [Acidobacteriota bacterium]|nr:hypothetical protein [Acidobacteriota bacterium]